MSLYTTPPKTFQELIAPFSEEVGLIALELREQVRKCIPKAEENIYGGKSVGNALYSIGGAGNVICGIQPATDFCRLYLHNVHDLRHPEVRLEGKGTNARHVKVRSVEEAAHEGIAWLIAEAAERGKKD